MRRNRIIALAIAVCALVAAVVASAAVAHPAPKPKHHAPAPAPSHWHQPHHPHHHWHHHPSPPPHHGGSLAANSDSYSTPAGKATIRVEGPEGVLANDQGDEPTIVGSTEPQHGTLELDPNGGFTYTPEAGFAGADSFEYRIADAVHLYRTDLPPIGNFNGVQLPGGSFGSSLAPVPGNPDEFLGLEDRGPNVEAPDKSAVEPKPGYDPAIARFVFNDGEAELVEEIPLRDSAGHPFSGLVNSEAPTGEKVTNLNGKVLAHDPDGYDPEGLVALPDGSFWVSDEYGPFITHFTADGREIERLSPYDGSLPTELRNRVPNRGMEGLTITPDGRTLVGMMQSALQQPDLPAGADGKKNSPSRIVTYNLYTHQVHEYLFMLDEPGPLKTANSEITALSNNTFLIDERDSLFPSATGYKKLWEVNLEGATDVGPRAHVKGAEYKGAEGGLLIGGKTIDATVWGQKTADATATLEADGIKPVSSSLYLDIDQLVTQLDPTNAFFDHDKVEGVVALEGGRRIILSNDNDFGISEVKASETASGLPWALVPKILPATGKQDDGEYLEIDMSSLPAKTSSATVTLNVTEGH
jgi:hypothetical protein